MANKYDSVELDIDGIFGKQIIPAKDRNSKSADSLSLIHKLVYYPLRQKYFHSLSLKGILKKRICSNIKTEWFDIFRRYWIEELGNRPIELHDYYYLMCNYRSKFQSVALPEKYDVQQFLKTWQKPELIYFLFHNWFSAQWSDYSEYLCYIPKNSQILEYGCGVAPIAEWLFKYAKHKNIHITCIDIETFHFHFARWRFKDIPYISTPALKVENHETADGKYDVIFIIQVLEHLPNPMCVIQYLTGILNQKGILIFDYIKSDPIGLNTKESQRERNNVLKFISDNFDCLNGVLNPSSENIGRIVCRKKFL